MARNRRHSSTRRVAWAEAMPEDIGPGDLLPWGVVREKMWGGPLGIHAWRVVVSDQVAPVWLDPKRQVMRRRAEAPYAAASVSGVVGTNPERSDDLRVRIRHFVLRHARLRRAI